MIEVKAGGGVVLRQKGEELQVLLIFRNGVWDLPKGKKEPAEEIEACARREVAEETGLASPTIERFLVKTHHRYKRNGKLYRKETIWFAMKAEEAAVLAPQKEEGITKVAWTEVTKATEKVYYKNLNKVLERIK